MDKDAIFQINARRCARCGGLLTSKDSIREGYGHSCKQKMRREQRSQETVKDQISFFENQEEFDLWND